MIKGVIKSEIQIVVSALPTNTNTVRYKYLHNDTWF